MTPIPGSWQYETDVLVVGGGNAGLPAAIEAHDRGARTLILESNPFLGGLMRGSGGYMFFCGTHVQRKLGVADQVEWGVEDELRMSEFRAIPEIVRAYVEGGEETCLWLEALGLTWAEEVFDGTLGRGVDGTRSVARTHVAGTSPTGYYPGGGSEGQSGYALTVVLEKAVEQRQIPILFERRMREIYRVPGGRVVGIHAESPGGPVDIRAHRAVILASGGATSNEQLIKAWDPRLVNDAVYSDGLPYMTSMGDALVAAEDIGAGLSDLSFACFTPIRYGSHWYSLSLSAIAGEQQVGRMTGVTIRARRGDYQRLVLVRGPGRRYINEAEAAYSNPALARDVRGLPPAEYPEEPFMRKFLSLPNPKNVWAVADAEQAGGMGWPLEQLEKPDPMHGQGLHPDSVATAGTIKELASVIHADPATLNETIRRYNESVQSGVDAEFGKPAPLYGVVKPPFYAVKLNVIRHTPNGGLRINSKAQVLDRADLWDGRVAKPIDEEAVIPGLYAAGECTAFVGFRRAHRKTGPILTMGRIAGRHAANETWSSH